MTEIAGDGMGRLDSVVDRLSTEFAGVFSRESIEQCVQDSHARLGPARIQMYQPLLAYRFARERLRATAISTGALDKVLPEVLFVCTHNAGRSQLAEALLAFRGAGRVTVRSAGTAPAVEIEPHVRTVLAELGIDLAEAYPKPLTDEAVAAADVIVTAGCGDACPVLPGRRYVDWDLPDPAGADLDTVRAVRDRIDGLITTLLTDLLADQENT